MVARIANPRYADSSWNQYIRAYFDLYRDSMGDTPFYPSVGNHELEGGTTGCGYQGYTDVYQLPANAPSDDEEEYYSFDWGNTHFVALDTNQVYNPGSPQYNWLVKDLQTSTMRRNADWQSAPRVQLAGERFADQHPPLEVCLLPSSSFQLR